MKTKISFLFVALFAAGCLAGSGHLIASFVGLSLTVTALGIGQPLYQLRANTLTNLIPDVYAALDVVSRELVGFIPSVARDFRADRIAKNQTIRVPYTAANTAGADSTAAMSIPAAADQTVANRSLSITKYREFPFSWSGEEQYAMNTGPGYLNIRQDQIAQAIRAAVNEIESYTWGVFRVGASRAYGTAGTLPFSTNTGEAAQMRRILDDNGAPASARSLIIDTATGAQLRTLTQLTKANEAGQSMTLRDGELLNLSGFSIKESAGVTPFTIGAMASATSSNAAYTVGQTVIPLATAGTGVVAAGDVITIAGQTDSQGNLYKFVVTSVSFAGANPTSGDSITIAAPGLRKAVSAATKAITVIGSSSSLTPGIAFSQNALLIATRLQVCPAEGDLAIMRETVTDSRSGLTFELRVYPGKLMNRYEIALAYDAMVVKPEHAALLVY